MSNILKVTTSIGGYDNSNTVRPNTQTPQQAPSNVEGPVKPDSVVRPDARSDASPGEQNSTQFKFDTNFDSFLMQIKNAPVLAQELPKIFSEYRAFLIESGIGENYAQEIDKFLSMIEVNDLSNIQSFIKNQSDSAVRFTGSFFDALRRVLNQTKSTELKYGILNFIKKYTDMAESQFTLNDIKRNLEQVSQRMLPKHRQQLEQLSEKMNYSVKNQGDMQQNIDALKKEILPFINKYITDIHDRGILRNSTAQIAQLISRYENGLPGSVIQSFEKLMDFQMFGQVFQNFNPANLFTVLSDTEFEKASRKNKEMDQLVNLLCKGAKGEAGGENKAVFKEIIKAMVLNESVYMPLVHFMLPLSYGGKLMFSEMWIDPDAYPQQNREMGKTVKGLIKFDIQDLGFFDLFFIYNNEKIKMQLNVPKDLQQDKDKIQEKVSRILSEHSITPQEFVIGVSDLSIPITEAFENLKERKNSVNVSV